MSHTPGPWEIHHYGDNEGDIHGSDGTLVCMMREGDTAPEDDWSANARLIAAAPDLLAAARLANQELLDIGQGSSGSPALVALWAAIAKAEGRE